MTISVVQSTSATGTAVISVTTPSLSTTTGNLGVVDSNNYLTVVGETLVISDSVGTNSYTNVQTVSAANVFSQREDYCNVWNGNAAHTITATTSTGAANGFITLAVTEITGQATSSVLDHFSGVASAASTGANTQMSAQSVNTTFTNELLINAACVDDFATGDTYAAFTGTQIQNVPYGSSFWAGIITSWIPAPTTGAYGAVSTQSLSKNYIAMLSSWVPAAGVAVLIAAIGASSGGMGGGYNINAAGAAS